VFWEFITLVISCIYTNVMPGKRQKQHATTLPHYITFCCRCCRFCHFLRKSIIIICCRVGLFGSDKPLAHRISSADIHTRSRKISRPTVIQAIKKGYGLWCSSSSPAKNYNNLKINYHMLRHNIWIMDVSNLAQKLPVEIDFFMPRWQCMLRCQYLTFLRPNNNMRCMQYILLGVSFDPS